MPFQLIGWIHRKGSVDGNNYDFVLLHVVSKLEQSETSRGMAGIEIRGEPFLVEHLKKLVLNGAIPVEIDLEQRATGKGQFKSIAVGIRPVPQPKAA